MSYGHYNEQKEAEQQEAEAIPEGATHYHPKNEEWDHHYIKVTNAQMDNEEVLVWCELRPEWGHWSDIPVWDKGNKDKYIKIDYSSQAVKELALLESRQSVQELNNSLRGEEC